MTTMAERNANALQNEASLRAYYDEGFTELPPGYVELENNDCGLRLFGLCLAAVCGAIIGGLIVFAWMALRQ
jgi:hypothetical protein